MKKTIITIVIVGLLILLAFWYLGGSGANTPSTSSLTATNNADTSNSADAQQIYSLLQQMNQVQQGNDLNDSIFSNPTFQNLKDNSVSFTMPPAGRDNPFAPIGSNSAAPSTTTINVRIK